MVGARSVEESAAGIAVAGGFGEEVGPGEGKGGEEEEHEPGWGACEHGGGGDGGQGRVIMVEARGRSASLGGGRWVYGRQLGRAESRNLKTERSKMGVGKERIVLVVDVVKLHLKL